jgi:hypothetical protein
MIMSLLAVVGMLIVLDDELEALRSMQPLDQAVFHYLAERVDFETGLIGQSRRVSYGGMAFDLSERESERRVRELLRMVTSKQVENSVTRLVNAGLLSRQSKSGFNQSLLLGRVFWVAALGKGHCVKKADGSAVGSDLGVLFGVLAKLSTNKNNHIEQSLETVNESTREPVGSAVGTTSFTHHQQQGDDKFTMTLDWQPTPDEFEMALFRAGKRVDAVKSEWVAEFVAYWFAEGKRRYSQREWTVRLAMRMVDFLRDPALFDRIRGSQPGKASSSASGQSSRPEWARIPVDDEQLQPWAVKHGFGQAEPWMSYQQYRNVLRNKVENKLSEWRRLQ